MGMEYMVDNGHHVFPPPRMTLEAGGLIGLLDGSFVVTLNSLVEGSTVCFPCCLRWTLSTQNQLSRTPA